MQKNKGFTLLELMLVIAIVSIMAAAVGPNFVSSGRLSIEQARKQKFISNYTSCILAANFFLMASDTTIAIRNTSTFNDPSVTTSGLGMLVASGVLTLETCEYENINGERRFFKMAIGPDNGVATISLNLWSAPAVQVTITLSTDPDETVDEHLSKGGTLNSLWDDIKLQ